MLSIQYDIMDAINTLNTAIATKNVVPPFSAHAQIFGDNKVRTFDGQIYSFDGTDCDYLLTSDFLHNRFSVVANFEGGKRTHLTIMTDEGKTIRISNDPSMKVKVDNRAINLPHHVQSSFIRREGNKVILENSEGLRVQCNHVHNTCSITVSGWYFGKTGGLLGIYDGEPSNDFMTPERKVVRNKDEFVTSWRVGEECTAASSRNNISNEPTMEETQACKKLFVDNSSPLLPCFKSIDPEKYMESCLHDMVLARETDKAGQGSCSSASAYIDLCIIRAGVRVGMPAHCATCKDDTDTVMEIGATKSYEAPNLPRSADVVFIVELGACLRGSSHNDLPRLINQALEERNLKDNRFAVVGYGGEAPFYEKTQVFTSAGEGIFAKVEKSREALER